MPLSGPAAVRGEDKAARDYSLTVKRRVEATSLEALEDFGRQAAKSPSQESLSRLLHVTSQMMSQREYAEAEAWNARMLDMAQGLSSRDYIGAAEINTAMINHLRDKSVSPSQVDALLVRYPSGLPAILARTLQARTLIDSQQSALALRLSHQTLRSVAGTDPSNGVATINLWRAVGLAHAQLDDISGYMTAMNRVEAEIAKTGYPWPEYEGIFFLALTLGYVGRYEEANAATQVYQELANRAGRPIRLALAGSLCGYVSAVRDDWAAVLECYAPFGPSLDVPEAIYNVMLPRRTVAYARTGQVALAQRDLTTLRNRLDSGKISFSPSIHRAEAEVMLAAGDYRRGVKALRDYHLNQFRTASQMSSAVMSEVVTDMDEQLRDAQAQSQQRAQTIVTQWWLIGVVALLLLSLIVLLRRQRRLARDLARANAREREESERRGQFFADISHEIRTPLNGVVAMADALRKEQLPPDVAEKVRLIATSSETLNRLLSDVLDNAKMEAGQLSIETAPFDLSQLMQDVEALWRDKSAAKGLKLELQSDLDQSEWVEGDSLRLSEVLNNLISNALKFTPEGRILINVVKLPHDRVLFVVTDTGIGLETDNPEEIFERYRQANGTITRNFGGTGLGLSISYNLVKLMGGKLNAASQSGKGAQFWFDLSLPPVAKPKAIEDVAVPVQKLARDPSGPMRLLIVDDNATNRTILGMLLGDEKYQLHYAVNGREAVDAAMTIHFDVILMDVQMPEMNGLDAIRHIRSHEQEVGAEAAAIVIFTANDSAEDYKRGLDAGADSYVSKPIVLDRLMEAIDGAIQLRAHQNASANQADIMSARLD